jgi:ABC-type multidrug transport system ATPase subunit/ABC-type multidrug transport system permease subunit
MIELLGLRACQNTIVGNELLRGVSGGEKKRVTVGEILLGPAKAVFLDEPTSGLDSSTAEDIMKALRQWCDIMQGSVVAALLQPTPEVFNLFDQLILLRDGACVYNGPRADVIHYLESVGVYCPNDVDYADFIIEYLSLPHVVYARQLRNNTQAPSITEGQPSPMAYTPALLEHKTPLTPAGIPAGINGHVALAPVPIAAAAAPSEDPVSQLSIHSQSAPAPPPAQAPVVPAPQPIVKPLAPGELPAPSAAPVNGYVASAAPAPEPVAANGVKASTSHDALSEAEAKGVPLTTAAMEKAFRESAQFPHYKNIVAAHKDARNNIAGTPLESPFAKAQYGQEFSHSFAEHTKICLSRQSKLMGRDKGLIGPRLGQSVFMGLVLGSLFYGASTTDFGLRIGLILFACNHLSFGNMVELPIMIEAKRVAYKQTAYRFFPTSSYVMSIVTMHIPLAFFETIIFVLFLYFMTFFTNDAGRFFIFAALYMCHNLAVSVWFRSLAFFAPNMEVAQVLAGPSTAIFMLFGGFLLTEPQIPPWFIWLYWYSPFSWTVRSISLNEFHAPRYNDAIYKGNDTTAFGYGKSAGNTYLDVWEINKNDDYIWAGAIYLLFFWVFFSGVSALILKYKKFPLSMGTRRNDEGDGLARDAALEGKQELGKGLKSDRATLSFNNVKFAVQLEVDVKADPNDTASKPTKKKVWRTLVRNVTGYARPGELTALMGASGAGKTTLLDVLAGRKTAGRVEGDILVNGYAKDAATFPRIAGYVEQTDNHVGSATVFETLLFSARMRLPADTTEATRVSFVEEVMEILELTDIRNRLIGDADDISLSPGQLKRVTIGVELVANPAILFLDEPTTGLDSRGAQTVVRVIRRVAARGRAVVCTIHQPSAELFYMFDRLLLLQAGGYQVYFGPVGHRGREIVKYFTAIPGCPPKPSRVNVASWMLEVIGAGTGAKKERSAELQKSLGDAEPVVPLDGVANGNGMTHAVTVTTGPAATSESAAKSTIEEEKPIHPATVYAHLYTGSPTANNQPAQDKANSTYPDLPRVTESGFARGWFVQLASLLERSFRSHWRNTAFNFTRFLVLTILGILFGLVYLQVSGDDQAGVTNTVASIYGTTCFCGVIHAATSLPVIFRYRSVFYREKASQTYSPGAYSVQLIVTELPYIAFASFLFVIPFYFMLEFSHDAGIFFLYLLGHFMCSIAFASMGILLSALLPNQMVAGIVQGLYFTLFFLFAGIFIPGPAIPAGWKWLYELNPVRHAVEALAMPQYECNDGASCPKLTVIDASGASVQYTHDFVAKYYDWKYGRFWESFGWIMLFIVVVNILAAWAQRNISHNKR